MNLVLMKQETTCALQVFGLAPSRHGGEAQAVGRFAAAAASTSGPVTPVRR